MVEETQNDLAVKESDVKFIYRKNGRLKQVTLSTNKVIEMRENGLLVQEKLCSYDHIVLIRAKKQLYIPIVPGSAKYGGQNNALLRFNVNPNSALRKSDLYNWHLQSTAAG